MSREVEDLNRRLLRARDAMDRAYAEPLDVRAVAAVAYISPAHFSRSFRDVFGETPHRYLQRRKVERSMFLLRETDRSVTDRSSFFGSSDIGWKFAVDDLESTPYEDPARHQRMSPISYVKNISTPLLIIHSESDLRCNIEQAEQLFAALKYMGCEVLFVRFEGQSHGLSRGGHPHSRLERLRHIRGWFEQHL